MKGHKRAMGFLAQAIASICGCLLALMLALNLTLFREGYYLHQLQNSGCLLLIYENISEAEQTIARTAGLRETILDEIVSQEDVDVAVIRRADEIWHGSTTQPDTPYADLVTYLQDTITKESGQMWTEADTVRYQQVQTVCEDMWRTNAVPPMANILNFLMQYRQVAWILVFVLAVLFVACQWLQIVFQKHWRQIGETLAAIGISVACGTTLTCIAISLSGWKNWMPATDAAYDLYVGWFRGLAPVVAACGFGLAALVWLASLYPYRMALYHESRKKHLTTKEQQL